MINNELKLKIVEVLKIEEGRHPSAAKFAVVLGISSAQLSRIKSGDIENVLAPGKWINIARKLDVQLNNSFQLKPAQTDVFKFINGQLESCQVSNLSGMLCDAADIGKTYAARYYARSHKFAIYIDCSQTKSKQKLIRTMAKELGLSNNGRYVDVYEDLVFYLKSIPNPLVILDEAGDLDYSAFLELKALWNATEYACGWYMMGADGLKAKIERNLNLKTVGYTELFSRYGSRYQKVIPEGKDAADDFVRQQIAAIAKMNGANNIQEIYAKSGGSLRRIYHEIQKMKK